MPKDFSRTERVAQALQVELAKLIEYQIKDPRIDVVTITGVEVSGDMSHAKIFIVTRSHDELAQKQAVDILNKAANFLRRRLGKEIQLRILPELHFHYDNSSNYGRRIDELLKDLKTHDSES